MTNRKLTATEKVIQFMMPLIFQIARFYWFVFRPHTYGVVVVLKNNQDILLVQHTYGSVSWTFPGGGIKNDESPKQAARREIKEELGVDISELTLCGRFTSRAQYKKNHITVFSAFCKQTITRDPVEIKRARWFKQSNLPRLGVVAQRTLATYEHR